MTASTKTRSREKYVDPATLPLDHGFTDSFAADLGRDWRVRVRTVYSRKQLESVLPEAEQRRLTKLVDEYKADRPNPLSSWKKFWVLTVLFGWLIAFFNRARQYVNVNASALGGGVKILLQDTTALMKAVGVPTEWNVLKKDNVALTVTKAIHNNLQGKKNPSLERQYDKNWLVKHGIISPRFVRGVLIVLLWTCPLIGRYGRFPEVFEGVARVDDTLTRTSWLIYRRWHVRLWRKLRWRLAASTDMWVHDPQPALLAYKMSGWNLHSITFRFLRLLRGRSPSLAEDAPGFNLIWRDHIDTNRLRLAEEGPARDTWLHIWRYIRRSHRFVFHPVGPDKCQNIPMEVPLDKAVGLPAISSLLEDTNRDMSDEEMAQALDLLNRELRKAGMAPINMAEILMLVAQVSRFCPAKRMDMGLAIMRRFIQIVHLQHEGPLAQCKLCPHFLQLGNGAGDDRDGKPVHIGVLEILATYDPAIAQRLRVLRLGHCDPIKNLVLRLIKVFIHPADREGWEDFVTCAIFHDVPAFVGDNAGPAEQVKDYQSGRLLPVTGPDMSEEEVVEVWAQALAEFYSDPELQARMKVSTRYWAENYNIEFTEGFEVENVLWLCLELSRNPRFVGGGRKLRDHVVDDDRYREPADLIAA